MNYKFSILKRSLLIISSLAGAVLVLGLGQTVKAQSNSNIRILVMGEDSDKNSISRTNDVFKRVLAELKEGMYRKGFRVVDEEFLAVEMGWKITERRPKTELIEVMKLANTSDKATVRSRAMVLFRLRGTVEKKSFATRIGVRINGEMYDGLTNEFKGSFNLPTSYHSAPTDCNNICMTEVIGEKAQEIATSLGDVLATKLAWASPKTSAPGMRMKTISSLGMVTTYSIKFTRFSTPEIMEILNTSEQFPGYQSHTLSSKKPSIISYEYLTTANASKMDKWISIVLMDMGLTPDEKVIVGLSGTEINLEKINSLPAKKSPVSRSRFN
jgi:hypothetical protein